jgi:RNA polymerase sigma-70 factor (ECF subfamily)
MLDRRKRNKNARHEEFKRVALVHLDLLYDAALRMTGNAHDAEDLVQDTFARAYWFFGRFKKDTNCKVWLFKIMRNRYVKKMRKFARRPSTVNLENTDERFAGEVTASGFLPSESYASVGLDELVEDDARRALEALPPEFRLVVILSDISGLSYQEIAEAMGTPIGTVRSRLSRARTILLKRLRKLAMEKGILRAEPAEVSR